MRIRNTLLAATILALPLAAHAQPVTGLYIAGGAGVNFMQDEAATTPGGHSTELDRKAGGVGVLSLGWGFGNGLRVEGEGDYRYNGANRGEGGDPALPPLSYQPGQALFDGADPAACIARATEPFLTAGAVDARAGQVGNVCFAQALVLHAGRWLLYYGMADSRIGSAVAPVPTSS